MEFAMLPEEEGAASDGDLVGLVGGEVEDREERVVELRDMEDLCELQVGRVSPSGSESDIAYASRVDDLATSSGDRNDVCVGMEAGGRGKILELGI